MKKMTKVLIVLTLISGFLAVAHAQFAKPEDAIQYRQSVMFLIGQHFGRMAAVVKGQSPYDKAAFEQNAAMSTPSPRCRGRPSWFPAPTREKPV